MLISRRATNQRAKYFLMNWTHYDKNITHLSEVEQRNMKILYSALKELDQEERRFLADKYRVEPDKRTGKRFKKDSIVAEEYGIPEKEYRERRFALETKFNNIIMKYLR